MSEDYPPQHCLRCGEQYYSTAAYHERFCKRSEPPLPRRCPSCMEYYTLIGEIFFYGTPFEGRHIHCTACGFDKWVHPDIDKESRRRFYLMWHPGAEVEKC